MGGELLVRLHTFDCIGQRIQVDSSSDLDIKRETVAFQRTPFVQNLGLRDGRGNRPYPQLVQARRGPAGMGLDVR